MSKIPSILECILLIAVAMSFSVTGIMAAGTTPVVQHIGSLSFMTSSVGQPIALFSGVLPVGINQGKGLFSGQQSTPIALGSLNAKRTIIQLDQTKPFVSVIPIGTNAPILANNPVNRTIPMVVAKPLNQTEPKVVTEPLNQTKALNSTKPTNITNLNITKPLNATNLNLTQPLNTTKPLNMTKPLNATIVFNATFLT